MRKYTEKSKLNLFTAFLFDNHINIISTLNFIIVCIVWYHVNIYVSFITFIISTTTFIAVLETNFFKTKRCFYKQIQFCHYKAKQEKIEKILSSEKYLKEKEVLKYNLEKKKTCLKISRVVSDYKLLKF